MDQKVLSIRRSHWEQIILEGNRAQTTKREWCRQNGIREKTFYYWQRKFRNEAVEALESSKAVPASLQSGSSFVEIPVTNSFNDPEGFASKGVSPELMLQIDDCRVFITGAIQEHTLRTVVKVIRNA